MITYRQSGETLIPDLKLNETEERPLGRYGRMRRTYLQTHRTMLWNSQLLSGTLPEHLLETDAAAQSRLELLMPELMKDAGATEALKARDPMRWVGLMNACKAQAEEIILRELVYS